MQLSTMQDLGGCRAVVRNVSRIDKLVDYYEKHSYHAFQFLKKYDYIDEPKLDGYRSIHLIYRYQGEHQNGAYKGLKIEVQIRSRMQHAWATAVETIDAFTGQALKTNLGGDESWKRFFSLMGTAIALTEKRPIVPEAPPSFKVMCAELRDVCRQLNIPNVFYGLSAGVHLAKTKLRAQRIYVLTLDSEKRHTGAIGFPTAKAADEHYLEMEKENKDKPHIQTVMVSLDSIRELRSAYPSFFMDTKRFIDLVEMFCQFNGDSTDEENAKGETSQGIKG